MPKRYPVEKGLEVVLAGLRSEDSVREICRQHGIETKTYYKWKHAFLEGGKAGLSGEEAGDTRSRELEVEVKPRLFDQVTQSHHDQVKVSH